MLTAGETKALQSALDAARVELGRLEALADAEDAARLPGWRWLVPGKARIAAGTARTQIESAERLRAELLALPGYDHEGALAIVELLGQVGPLRQPLLGELIEQGAVAAGEAVKRAAGSLIPWWVWVLLALVVFLLAAPTAAAVATLFRKGR